LNAHDAAAGIGEAQCWLSLGQNAKAIELLERLAKENPQNTDVLINLSNAYLEAHELPDAEAAAQHAVLSDPSSYAARRILAEIAFEQHNLLHAIALGRQILARFPQQESAYLFLARCYAYQSALPREAGDLVVLARKKAIVVLRINQCFECSRSSRAPECRLSRGFIKAVIETTQVSAGARADKNCSGTRSRGQNSKGAAARLSTYFERPRRRYETVAACYPLSARI
jgi:tetratricopeptide (TPR) repeat protein